MKTTDSYKAKMRLDELLHEKRSRTLTPEEYKELNDSIYIITESEYEFKANPALYGQIGMLNLKNMITGRNSKRIFKNKQLNTVVEYITYYGYNEFYNPFMYWLCKTIGTRIKYVERRACIVRYVSLEASIYNVSDFLYYEANIAKLFDFLVKKKAINGVFYPSIISYDIPTRYCYFIGLSTNLSDEELNKLLGFVAFVNEAESIDNFDWKQIDNL
jgi:hypothetical protein